MTAESERFIAEDVIEAAKEAFGDQLPEYDHVDIPEEWMSIWSKAEFPNTGKICLYTIDDKLVASIEFDVEFQVNLVLRFPDGKIIEQHNKFVEVADTFKANMSALMKHLGERDDKVGLQLVKQAIECLKLVLTKKGGD